VNLGLNLKYFALLAAALMLAVIMAFTAYSIIESDIASAKSANSAYNAGGGNKCETAAGKKQTCTAADQDPGNSGGRNNARG
jgi:hypothetical protein